MSQISRDGNSIYIGGELGNQDVHFALAKIYEAFHKKGYQDIVLDFTSCTAAFPAPMAILCAQAAFIQKEGITCYYNPPKDEKLARLFINSNYAHIIDPQEPRSRFIGFTRVPLTQYHSTSEQSALVNKMVECILTSMRMLTRADMAAVEWAINEITDNVTSVPTFYRINSTGYA